MDYFSFIKRDAPYIIAIILCLGLVAYDLYYSGDYADKCNAHWLEELERLKCEGYYANNFTEPFEHPLGFINLSKISEVEKWQNVS